MITILIVIGNLAFSCIPVHGCMELNNANIMGIVMSGGFELLFEGFIYRIFVKRNE